MAEPEDPPPLTPPVVPEAKQVSPELLRGIAQMLDDVANRPFNRDLMRRFDTLVDMLVGRGHLAPYHGKLLRRTQGRELSPVRLSVFQDKRTVSSTPRDCAALLHLCRGRCCAMDVSLSAQDVAERTLTWDLHQPYLLAKDPDHGYCAHHGADGQCTIYDERPGPCRAYDCAHDPRVWEDFDALIPAPMPWWLVPPEERGQPSSERRPPAPDDDFAAAAEPPAT